MQDASTPQQNRHPFRRAVLRGLGVILPLLMTIVFLLWVWNSVQSFVLTPMKNMVRSVAVNRTRDIMYEVPDGAVSVELHRIRNKKNPVYKWVAVGQPSKNSYRVLDLPAFRTTKDGEKAYYCQLPSREWIPHDVYDKVRRNPGTVLPETAEAFFRRYVDAKWFRPAVIFPFVLSLFLITLYLLGKIIAARIGRAILAYFERLINQVPLINTVYSTVKKVTDIVFGDHDVEFNRVVAVQYPRKDMWSLGFVTGESLPSLRAAAGEPILSVLMPTSPMPATGFTVSVRKSETIELAISVDQAFQFVVSCGVVIPGELVDGEPNNIAKAIEGHVHQSLESHQTPTSS